MLQYEKTDLVPSKNIGSPDILRVLEKLEDDENIVRFFTRDNYEVYKEGAMKVANILHKQAHIQFLNQIPVLAVTAQQLAIALKELLKSHRIEIWNYNSVRNSWKVNLKASPGNLEQIEALFTVDDIAELPLIASVYMRFLNGERRIGLAVADTTRFSLGWTSFVDTELYENLESLLVQLDPREVIYQKNEEFNEIIGKFSLVGTALEKSDFQSDTVLSDLNRLCSSLEVNIPDIPLESQSALASLINYLGLLNNDCNLNAFTLSNLDLSKFMRLDETALRALNVFPADRFGKGSSLYGILDQCKTKQGSRLLAQWLRQPLTDIEEIIQRQNVVTALVENNLQRQRLRDEIMRGVPDISRISRKLVRGGTGLQDLVLLYTALTKMEPIHGEFGSINAINDNAIENLILRPLCKLSSSLAKFAQLIESTIDFEALNRHEYCIRADFDPSLAEISNKKEAILDGIDSEFKRVSSVLGLERGKKIKLENNSTYGYHFRISRLDGSFLSGGGREDFIELAALKSGILFVSSKLKGLNEEYDDLCKEYSQKQSVLVKEIVNVASSYRRLFDELNNTIAVVDVLISFAYVAAVVAYRPWVRPQLMAMGSGVVDLKEARHPCVEMAIGASFIPNDVSINEQSTLQLITGPNMGGKSTFIRQTALISLLSQIGSYVPCSAATLPLFDAILVRVGAGDSIIRGISTFMMEMLEMSTILRSATKNSLVIIDELGRGTSTSEGFGLAWGVCKELASRGCTAMFATHFHELTNLSKEIKNIKNIHASADCHGELIMTYRMMEGTCDQSFGIEIAKMAGFPDVVIKIARIMLAELEGRMLTEEQAKQILANNNDGVIDLNNPLIKSVLN